MKIPVACLFVLFAIGGQGDGYSQVADSQTAPTLTAPARADRLDPAKTHALIVGVLTWQQRSLTRYSPESRQDVALGDALLALGVPKDNITLLLDKQATRAAIEAAVETIAKQAGRDSTLIIYYAGHGMVHAGEGIFACYDLDTQRMQETGWRQSRLTRAISKNFSGKRILLFADCCFSGSLKNVAKSLQQNNFQAASITSAQSANTSTSNWTFTHSLIEVLSGEPVGDHNGDDWISLGEAAQEAKLTLGHFERQASGASFAGLSKDFRLSKTSRPAWITKSDTFHSHDRGQFIDARIGGVWKPARVIDARTIGKSQPELLVQAQAYNQRPRFWVSEKNVRATSGADATKLKPLPEDEAMNKASLGGKLTKLLHKLKLPSDGSVYGEFYVSGNWSGTRYRGFQNLTPGYWVYVYPDWYIWEHDAQVQPARPLILAQPMEPEQVELQAPASNWAATQLTGKPNTLAAGDSPKAWASVTEDENKVWIELDYKTPVKPAAVHVVETYNPGAVYQVSCVIDGTETLLWKGKDPTPTTAAMGTSKIPLNAKIKVDRIRVYLDSPSVPGWNEIDAVGLVDSENNIQWAADARASSDYATGKIIPFVDPFLTKEDRIREQRAKLMNQINQRKTTVRQLQQTLDQANAEIKRLYKELDALEP